MNLGFLDKSSKVTPLLVRLYDGHKVYGLGKDKKPEARAELTDAVSELLEMDLSPRENELIADVLIALLRQAELDLRCALAEKLSVYDNVPLRLILQIANDDICVAEHVLMKSPILGDLDLTYIIKAKPAEYWQAIANRYHLGNQVMNMLVDTRDFDTAVALAQNMNLTLTDHTIVVLSDLAQEHEDIAAPLLHRDVIPDDIAGSLYQCVGRSLKQYILDNYDLDKSLLIEAIDEVVLDIKETTRTDEFMPTEAMLRSADRFKEKKLLTIKLVMGTLKHGQIRSFIAQFSKFTGLSPVTVLEILGQNSGQGLAVACKAFDIYKSDFISIYLLTNRTRSQGRTVDLKNMARATQYFDSVKPDVAKGIMSNSIENVTSN